jgi:predicted enzyme related to lactoylglutathione lyase
MPTMTSYNPGTFCWVDFAAPDQEAAKNFYSAVFGWTSNDMTMPQGGVYSMMQKDGQNVGAIMQKPPGHESVPAHWNSYISVDNLDATVTKAASLGATIAMPAMDVPEAGRMAAVQDPSGASVFFWQPGQHIGAGITGDTGTVCWNELLTKDTNAAGSFYEGLLGWNVEKFPMPGMEYTIFKNGDTQTGGMFAIDPSWGPVPPNWMVYFAVENCDASCEKIKSLGGNVLMGPNDVPTVGRFATCQDSQGGAFAILQPEPRG